MDNINLLKSEQRNQKTLGLDQLTTLEFIKVMNEEDYGVVKAVEVVLKDIAEVIDEATIRIRNGGRIIYVGAGTSGRLGILDAVECQPTFSTTDEVIALIAGGNDAFVKAKEGAEDSQEQARKELAELDFNDKDILIAIAASGRTPYCIGALTYAKEIGACGVALACNKNSLIAKHADYVIEVESGSEVITGSTRLKAGTATKMILNMISTATMVNLGKTYSNLMIDVKPTNLKLIERTKTIVMEATQCTYEEAQIVLEKCDYKPKIAIIMILLNCNVETAIEKLIPNQKINNIIENR